MLNSNISNHGLNDLKSELTDKKPSHMEIKEPKGNVQAFQTTQMKLKKKSTSIVLIQNFNHAV